MINAAIPRLNGHPTEPVLWQGTVYGQPVSKSNRSQIIKIRGRPSLIPSKEATRWKADGVRQICFKTGRPQFPITEELIMFCNVYYRSRQADLDETLIMDLLQVPNKGAGVIKNDRQIRTKIIDHFIDRDNPRAEIRLVRRHK
jgi:hypothetical protein